ncbi:putative GIY-YIG superfamily endonuclease [Sphingobium boeckii]|uniref:Putative GIY-YIG superfamily endonuclease n=1 Tax=Sphingobium boeckii TaxID=1082345 RepID=A0A7W9EEZ2_9SPHN|nr:putative GIY-YIG superfamily endonuclease [Sphingobium boeckii]
MVGSGLSGFGITLTFLVTPGLTRGPAFLQVLRMGSERKGGWVYIMADRYRGTMYVGVTTHLAARIYQHRRNEGSDFCTRYRLTRLVWAERGDDILQCIAPMKSASSAGDGNGSLP